MKIEVKKWDKYWKFKIIGEIQTKLKTRKFLCQCECWNIKEVALWHLRNWHTKSCWCSKLWLIHMSSHMMTRTRFYRTYQWIKTRCYNINHLHYKNYWWRWIKCEWESFEEFKNDMYDSYLEHCKDFWEKQTTIDRIDGNWNYCKENCRWATYKEQNRNNRNNIFYNYKWKTATLAEFSEIYWIKINTLKERIKRWWNIEKTLTEKIKINKYK